MATSFFVLLIQDPQYYSVSERELGTLQGTFSTYVAAATLPVQFFSGFVLDKCGRKVTISVCCFIASILVAVLPYGAHLYPGLFLISFFL